MELNYQSNTILNNEIGGKITKKPKSIELTCQIYNLSHEMWTT
jgi:hypothetical protein